MVNEKQEYDGEEEYHFSDDQIDYDIEAEHETAKPATRAQPAESHLSKIGKATSNRRVILAGIVCLVLIGIVYNMLRNKEESSVNVAEELSKPLTDIPQATIVVDQPALIPVNSTIKKPTVQSEQQQTAIAPAQVENQETQQQTSARQPEIPPSAQIVEAPATTASPTPVKPLGPTPTEVQSKILERLASLEQQNSALMNLLQTEYAQKISDFDMQSNLTRSKIDELNKRINRIDSALNQLTQMAQADNTKAQTAPATIPNTPPDPRIGYSVQAIIPGRAWLKSESGDTVTVAEGDILRNYGRITKIDPYDGIVEIDTGGKTIALSYGLDAE